MIVIRQWLNLPVYQRGTSMTRETTIFRVKAQAISIFVLRNLLLYSGTVQDPSSQSWYGVARLMFWITWMNFLMRLLLVLNSLQVTILMIIISRVWTAMMTRNTWNASPKVRKV